jgi:hypothetical protein
MAEAAKGINPQMTPEVTEEVKDMAAEVKEEVKEATAEVVENAFFLNASFLASWGPIVLYCTLYVMGVALLLALPLIVL